MNYDTELGVRLREARERQGISQSELARRMRRSGHVTLMPGRVNMIEHGRRRLAAAEVTDVCRILRVPPWRLLGMTPEEAAALDEEWGHKP